MAPRGLGLVHPERASYRDESEGRIKLAEGAGIGRDDGLISAPRADHDMGISDVGRPARGEEPAYVGCVDSAQPNDVRGRLADQP